MDARGKSSHRYHLWLILFLCMGNSDFCIRLLKKETATEFSKLVFSSTKECQARISVLALPSA